MNKKNFDELLERYKENPFEIYRFETGRCGIVYLEGDVEVQSRKISFKTCNGNVVNGSRGTYRDIPGTILYSQMREGNIVPIFSEVNGEVMDLQTDLNNKWVEAGTSVLSVKHQLTKEEVIDKILQEVLFIYSAPEPAKYRFTPELAQKIEKEGLKKVLLRNGEEFLVKSKMKKEETMKYDGEGGIIYAQYFSPNIAVRENNLRLFGICPPDRVKEIDRTILKVSLEWEI